MFKLFGLGPWQVRLLPLLSGMAIFLIFSRLVYKYTKSDKYTLFFMLLFMSDRVINLSLHSGRMDMLSLFFVVLSMLIFERTLEWQGSVLPVSRCGIRRTASVCGLFDRSAHGCGCSTVRPAPVSLQARAPRFLLRQSDGVRHCCGIASDTLVFFRLWGSYRRVGG